MAQNFEGANFWQMKLENTFDWRYFGGWAISRITFVSKALEFLKLLHTLLASISS